MVYLAAMAHNGLRGSFAVVLVEIVYVTLTAGFYAGMQQKALGLRASWLGNAIVVLGVPGLAQALDWTVHRVSGAVVPGRATLAVSLFAALSALFHLHIMRNGVLLTGSGRSLADDLRRIPWLVAGFMAKPAVLVIALASDSGRVIE